MRTRVARTPWWRDFLAVVAFGACIGACTRQEPKKPGELVVSIDTDMAMPDQVDDVRIRVLASGQVLYDVEYNVGPPAPDVVAIPATLVVVAGPNPSTPVNIVVAGAKDHVWRTYREATTTIPTDRSATLRMPVQWLCDGTARSIPSSDGSGDVQIQSTCSSGNTCVAGSCQPSKVPADTLEEYQPEKVFGGGTEPSKGTCFDTLPCMMEGSVVEPDATCTIAPADVHDLNVALRVAADGICDSTQTWCFVPLDGTSDEGWKPTPTGDRIQLPRAACDKLRAGTVSGVYASNTCRTKTTADPPCGKWSSVQQKAPPVVHVPDASVPPTGTLIAALESEGGAAPPCCPLLSDGKELYTCVCPTETNAKVVAIDPATGANREVAGFAPAAQRRLLLLSAALFGDAVYWPDNDALRLTPLSRVDAGATAFPVDGSIYTNASLVVDETAAYALASGVASAKGGPVQLLKVTRDGHETAFDTGSNQAILQFGADQKAIYLASTLGEAPDGSPLITGTSRVVRIAKSDGTRTDAMRAEPFTAEKPPLGAALNRGYVGVQTDDSSVFALYAEVGGEAGATRLEVRKAALPGSATINPTIVYETTIDPSQSTLSMLGAADGAVVLSRVENDSHGKVKSSYVAVLPKQGGTPRVVANSAVEYALPGLALDSKRIYWLDSSGKIFALPREALN